MTNLPYLHPTLAKDGSTGIGAAIDLLFPDKISFVDSMRTVADLIVSCQHPEERSDENAGIVGRTVTLYIAASGYCCRHGGSVEELFPAIARDFNEMKAVKYEGDNFRDVALYRHLN